MDPIPGSSHWRVKIIVKLRHGRGLEAVTVIGFDAEMVRRIVRHANFRRGVTAIRTMMVVADGRYNEPFPVLDFILQVGGVGA